MANHSLGLCGALLLPFVAFGQSSQSTQDHIKEVETGLGPPIEVHGLPPDRRSLLAEMKKNHVPAVSIAVVHNGQIEWAKGYGTTRENGPPVTADTLFQAASITKSVSSMAALHLVEEGKLSLDAPIESELKSWKLPENSFTSQHPVTLRELLSSTGGASVHGFAGYQSNEAVPTLKQVLDGAKPANSPPILIEVTPGTEFRYSGGGYTIVQQAMIDATGLPYSEIMKNVVLDPAGMRESTYEQPLSLALLSKAAWPVDEKGIPNPLGPHTYPEMAAASLWTTPSDLGRWIIAMQHSLAGAPGSILSSSMAHTMITPIKEQYGLGVKVQTVGGRISFDHSGSNAGYKCMYVAYPDGDGAVVMTDSDNGFAIIGEVLTTLGRIYHWPAYEPESRVLAQVSVPTQTQYAGTFAAKDEYNFEIGATKTGLQLTMPGHSATALLPSSPNSYFVTDNIVQLVFETPDKGVVVTGEIRVPFVRTK